MTDPKFFTYLTTEHSIFQIVSGKDLAILLVQETLHDTEAPDSCDAELVELLILGKKKARSSCTNPDVLFYIM